MNAQLSKKSKFFCLMMTFVMILEFFATTAVPAFASQQKTDVDNDPEVAVVAQELEKIFANGVSQENLNRYVLKNFSNKELTVAEKELDVNYNPFSLQSKNDNNSLHSVSVYGWNNLGQCMYNKIKDEFFAMVNIGVIVKYAKKKAWKELAKVVIRFAKGAGVRTNAAIVAAQLAVWAVMWNELGLIYATCSRFSNYLCPCNYILFSG